MKDRRHYTFLCKKVIPTFTIIYNELKPGKRKHIKKITLIISRITGDLIFLLFFCILHIETTKYIFP